MPCNRSRPSLYSLSYIKRGKTRNYLYPIWSPYAYYLYCYKYRITLREKMLPCCYKSITYKEEEDLTLRPRCCLQSGLQAGRSTEQGKDQDQLQVLYSFDSNTGVCGGEDQCGFRVCDLPKRPEGQRWGSAVLTAFCTEAANSSFSFIEAPLQHFGSFSPTTKRNNGPCYSWTFRLQLGECCFVLFLSFCCWFFFSSIRN
uniref:Ornithine decarboxylase antizyme 3 n=1 Tax=Chinchilla lanigera TaxID=34839 RepID=A0A8C2UJB1_CHILA